ncbi:retrovirus-related pol polyprotein from transposon TNT 1-94 [Tanacetum coccineum]|uniref:Retrovirus-related pol polyprotein from transposon TNT 1-94 n=1 Tax=Tanacetum coccineum TaxID=301880 RepID=A0ABQ4YGA7_9ASTR
MHNNIMAAGSKDRPPMLGPGRYSQWHSRFLRYLDTKSNGEYLRKCIFDGPYLPTNVLIAAVEAAENILPVAAHEEVETIHNMTAENKLYFQAEKEAIFLILTGIGDEIYSTVDACNTAKEMWTAIERLQQGESLNVQDVKTNLFWEFGKFTSRDGESMESYYSRFYKLMNELTRNNLQVSPMQVNVQFLQQLQPEWSRFVTVVKQRQEIDTVSYHKLFDVLKQFQNEVNDIRSERLARSANPLALLAAAQPYSDNYYQAPKPQRSNAPSYMQSSSTRPSASTRHKGKEIAKPVTPQSKSVSEEDNDPEQARRDKDMKKNLALLAKYFKKLYKPTNNNLRTSSNSRNKTEDTTPRYNNDNQSGQFGNQRTDIVTTNSSSRDGILLNNQLSKMQGIISLLLIILRASNLLVAAGCLAQCDYLLSSQCLSTNEGNPGGCNSKKIPFNKDKDIVREVIQSTNRGHETGVGRMLPGTSSRSSSLQPALGYCTQEEADRLRKENEELKKAVQSQQLEWLKFVNHFNAHQTCTSSQYPVPSLYIPQAFSSPGYTPPNLDGYRPTYEDGSTSQIVHDDDLDVDGDGSGSLDGDDSGSLDGDSDDDSNDASDEEDFVSSLLANEEGHELTEITDTKDSKEENDNTDDLEHKQEIKENKITPMEITMGDLLLAKAGFLEKKGRKRAYQTSKEAIQELIMAKGVNLCGSVCEQVEELVINAHVSAKFAKFYDVVEFNIEAAQQGNVYIDEVDKITKKAESMDINVFRICDTNYDSRGCTEAYVASTENPEAFLIKVLQGILQKNGKIRSSFSKDVFDSHGYDISDYYDEIEVLVVAGASSGLIQVSDLEETKGMCSYMHDAGIAMEMMKQDKARKLLAKVLVKGLQGNRPVTLIGFSRGAQERDSNALTIWQKAIMLELWKELFLEYQLLYNRWENWIAARKVKISTYTFPKTRADSLLGYDDDDNGVRYDL